MFLVIIYYLSAKFYNDIMLIPVIIKKFILFLNIFYVVLF